MSELIVTNRINLRFYAKKTKNTLLLNIT